MRLIGTLTMISISVISVLEGMEMALHIICAFIFYHTHFREKE